MKKELPNGPDVLYKGIFWIVDPDQPENNKEYCFRIPVTAAGVIISDTFVSNAKSGSTYNHEATWNAMSGRTTRRQPFDHYPRGRVEIKNGTADIFLSPHINVPDIIGFIKEEFRLTAQNGIRKIRIHADGSEHYKCYLD